MATNLMTASRQWAQRPDDERFWTLEEMFAACDYHRETAIVAEVQNKSLQVVPVPCADPNVENAHLGDLQLVGKSGVPAIFTDYSFRQFCNRAGAPTKYMQALPAELAAANLNYGIGRMGDDARSVLLFHKNGSLVMRAATSHIYRRIWNADVVKFLMELRGMDPNWRTPPAYPTQGSIESGRVRHATLEDVTDLNGMALSLTIKEGDLIGPAGLYASSHDMFAFLIHASNVIEVGGDKLMRGFFIQNSEVGASSLKFTGFLFDGPCGNHICWGARDIFEINLRHVGDNLMDAVNEAYGKVRAIADQSADEDVTRIKAAKAFILGKDKDEVVKTVIGKRITQAKNEDGEVVEVLGRKEAEKAYDLAVEYSDVHGDPNSAWGFASGMTRLSQQTPFTDKRTRLDKAAGKVLQMAF